MAFLSKYYKIVEQDEDNQGIDFEVIRKKLTDRDSFYVDEGTVIIWLRPEEGSFAYLDKTDKEFTFSHEGKTWQIDFSRPVPSIDAGKLSLEDLLKI